MRSEENNRRCSVVAPHQLSHSCATLLLNAGAPILTVQTILGHQRVGIRPWATAARSNLNRHRLWLNFLSTKRGKITRPHDIQLLDDLVENFIGVLPADKGFIDEFRQALLAQHGVVLMTPPCKRMTTTIPRLVLKVCGRLRKRVETVGSHLTERFAVARIRVRDLWHFQHR